MGTFERDDYERERALDKAFEQEPRTRRVGPRNEQVAYEESCERLAGFGQVETASQDEAVPEFRVFGWRPSDRSEP